MTRDEALKVVWSANVIFESLIDDAVSKCEALQVQIEEAHHHHYDDFYIDALKIRLGSAYDRVNKLREAYQSYSDSCKIASDMIMSAGSLFDVLLDF